jgi:hypothetical protein
MFRLVVAVVGGGARSAIMLHFMITVVQRVAVGSNYRDHGGAMITDYCGAAFKITSAAAASATRREMRDQGWLHDHG